LIGDIAHWTAWPGPHASTIRYMGQNPSQPHVLRAHSTKLMGAYTYTVTDVTTWPHPLGVSIHAHIPPAASASPSLDTGNTEFVTKRGSQPQRIACLVLRQHTVRRTHLTNTLLWPPSSHYGYTIIWCTKASQNPITIDCCGGEPASSTNPITYR